jgi:hypothetical protein
MSRRLAEAPDADLERALLELGRSLPIPAERDLAEPVVARLRAEGPSRPAVVRLPVALRPARTLRRAAMLAAALLILVAGVAVAGRLGLPGVRIIFSKTPPSIPPTSPSTHPSPTPSRPGSTLGLGDRVSLQEARAAVSFSVREPSMPGLGRPDAIYLRQDVPGGRVSLVYLARPGFPAPNGTDVALLITELEGRTDRQLVGKMLGPGAFADPVEVDGDPGLWLHGAPHEVFFLDGEGSIVTDTVRLAGNVLLWRHDGVLLRLEGPVTRQEALLVASSLE